MSTIRIVETSKKGGKVPKEASYVIATSPPVPRGGLRPNGKSNGKSNGNGNGNGKKKVKKQTKRRGWGRVGPNRMGKLETLNAFGKSCLGLPRAVGDYTYVTTIDNVTVTGTGAEQLWCFTPFIFVPSSGIYHFGSQGPNFTSFFAYSSLYGGMTVAPTASIRMYNSKAVADAMVGGTEMVPASYSIRITCPTALQTAKGQYFLGKWNIAADPREYPTYKSIADGFMSYGQPRPLTAARLAMRGVQVNAMPRNMAECSEFAHASPNGGTAIQDVAPYDFDHTTGTWSGLSPIFLIVEESTAADTSLNVQIAIKWRYRFPMNNPAAKTHSYQGIGTDNVWNDVCRDASTLGHGVEAIPEAVEALF